MVRSRVWWLTAAGIAIGLLVFAAMLTPRPVSAQGDPTPTSASPEALMDAAREAIARADNAVNIVNTMLSFIESAGVIGGVLLGIGGFLGLRTIFDYRSQLDRLRAELNEQQTTADANLREQQAKASATIAELEENIRTGLTEVRVRGDRAIRALALLQLGEQQMEAKNMRAALQTHLEAYQYDPDNRATNFFLGELYIQQRDMVKGIEHLERTKNERGELYAPAEAGLAYALRVQAEQQSDPVERNKLYAEAEGHFIQALKRDPNMRDINGESFYGALGGLYRRRGQIADAIRCYEEAERVTPHSAYPVNNLAMLHFLQGNIEESNRYFNKSKAMAERALETQPGDYWQRFNVITALTVLGDRQAALDWLAGVKTVLPSAGPLESLLGGLNTLKQAPQPPADIDIITDAIKSLIEQMRAEQDDSEQPGQR